MGSEKGAGEKQPEASAYFAYPTVKFPNILISLNTRGKMYLLDFCKGL